MKKDMPLEGLRWSRDSGSALCDTSQNSRSRTGWGGKVLYAQPILQGVYVPQGHHPYPTARRAKIRLLCFRGHDGLSFFSLVTHGEVSCLSVIERTGLYDTQLYKQR